MFLFYQKSPFSATFGLYRDLAAGFVAAASEHCLAGFGGHASAKTVHSGAFPRLWLICSLWHMSNIVADFTILAKSSFK
jgi:hypothetical protein